jgi:3-phosphoshikimate 1-carboxyvinyltransferase
VEEVGINETRIGFVRVLQAMGARVEIEHQRIDGAEPVGRIVVESGGALRGIEVGGDSLVQSMIDELPLLAAVASRARGRTVVRDAAELKTKDTDRIANTVSILRRFGVRIEPREDGFEIEESDLVCPETLHLPPDHRVIFAAMMLASLLDQPTAMSGWERVGVSMPDCLEVMGQFATTDRVEQPL